MEEGSERMGKTVAAGNHGRAENEGVARNLDEVKEAVDDASRNFDIWWVYRAKGSHEQYVDVLNQYPLFFETAIHAHFVALFIALYRVFETRPDTMNVSGVLGLLQRHLSGQEKHQVDDLIKKAKPLWVKVAIVRSEVFAHRSKTLTVEKSLDKAKLSPNELRELIGLCKKIVNCLSHSFDRSSFAFPDAEGDTRRLLDVLKGYKPRRLQQRD
jgi:hypothetical protein